MLIASMLVSMVSARGQGSDDQYVYIYNQIQEAELLESTGQSNQALAKYLQAQTALQRFQRVHPEWNAQVVKFRLSYLEGKVAGLSAKDTAPITAPTVRHPGTPPVPTEVENQVNAIKEQMRQLLAEKTVLEAKLKEALASQPAALDPRELARAEERVKTLQKENDLLKVSLNQAKSKASPATVKEPKPAPSLQPALAESNRKLAEQTEKANALAAEKVALQKKLESLAHGQSNAASMEASKKALASANRELADQKLAVAKVLFDKEALEARLRFAQADAEALASMRVQNERLQKQLLELKSSPRTAAKSSTDATRQLAQAKAQISLLQSDNETLRMEKVALERRLKQVPAPVLQAKVTPVPAKAESPGRVRQLEQERDRLQQQLAAALKDASSRKGKPTGPRVEEVENQLTALRARLEVFEARRVPYTPEELALFKEPDTKLSASVDLKASRKAVKGPPAGSATLVAEAQRYFADKRLDKAEERYLQVLHQDEKNVYTLANLAAIQLELGHLSEAEQHITQAVALAPSDAYSLSILGYLRFKQQKYDDALDALSRAAKSEPENAEIQNYLGLTLGQKGMRGPAETALRKAIQLEPSYGSAHNNLAVVYLAQQPPSVELARWHYQKALAVGHPRNPELEKMLEAKRVAERGP